MDDFRVVTRVEECLAGSDKRSVLIVEDDDATRKLLATGLRKHGFEPIEAADGEAGLNLAGDKAPDLILLDLNLPGAHGLEVLQQLKRSPSTAAIPVIVVTGDAELRLGARARVLALGAADFVTKPFEMNALIEEVQTLIPSREAQRVGTSSGG